MPTDNLPEPTLITKAAVLRQAAEQLSQEKVIAVDTESNSLFAYHEKVCLVQFSTSNTDYLVDPLAVNDLSPLGEVFANPEIEKVFHAAEYDVICLKRDYGFEFNHLFDTMAAARVLGRKAVGLGAILEEEFGIHLDKHYQRADWGKRPLTPDLLAYARLDTHYLIPLRSRLQQLLKEKGLFALAQEDFERLRLVNGHINDAQPPTIWRIRGAADLSPQQAAILNELNLYRERMARSMDRPVFKVINDQTLVDIARLEPHSLVELSGIRGMSEAQMRRHGNRLFEAVGRGLNSPPLYPPKNQRPNEQYLERLDALRRWRKAAGLKMGVDSDIVLPRDLLYALAEQNPQTLAELAKTMHEVPWRLDHFGTEMLEVIAAHQKKK